MACLYEFGSISKLFKSRLPCLENRDPIVAALKGSLLMADPREWSWDQKVAEKRSLSKLPQKSDSDS